MFPSTYHQGSVQYYTVTYNTRSHKCIITYKTQLHTIHGHIQYQGPRNRGARATKVSFNSTKVPSQLTKSALSVNKNAFSVLKKKYPLSQQKCPCWLSALFVVKCPSGRLASPALGIVRRRYTIHGHIQYTVKYNTRSHTIHGHIQYMVTYNTSTWSHAILVHDQ